MTPLGSVGTSSDTCDATPLSITTTSFSLATGSTGSPFKDKLVAYLNIPVELTNHVDVNLGYAWQKYKAYLAAVKTCNMQ